MPFTKQKDQDFFIQNNQIILSEEYKNKVGNKFKKITGSRLYNVLGLNEMSSSFKTWCTMVNIYTEPMDEMMANAGNVIEPKIRQWVEKTMNKKYLVYDPKKCKYDVFENNPIFGGIPDGEPITDGTIDYSNGARMLEIKTSSIDSFVYKKIDHVFILQKDNNSKPIIKEVGGKKAKWFDSKNNIQIPEDYKFQLGLYCYLRNVTKGLFAICFLKTEDYLNPEACDVNEREIQLVEFDINLDIFKHWIEQAITWYDKHILTGISPKMTNDDQQFVKDLLNL